MNWTRSSLCHDVTCVEVTEFPESYVGVRNGRHPGAVLTFTPDEWEVFIAGVKLGEFDKFGMGREVTYVGKHGNGNPPDTGSGSKSGGGDHAAGGKGGK